MSGVARESPRGRLTGNGRMPSEGEALLNWMLANEQEWRLNSLADAVEAGPG